VVGFYLIVVVRIAAHVGTRGTLKEFADAFISLFSQLQRLTSADRPLEPPG
jgi:hypothetical protein